ncbi:MAG TPA: hypothetical protein VJ809_06940 [Pirellulales bacterium]|nr:hypothetical protein [Pirellulales bacterium]
MRTPVAIGPAHAHRQLTPGIVATAAGISRRRKTLRVRRPTAGWPIAIVSGTFSAATIEPAILRAASLKAIRSRIPITPRLHSKVAVSLALRIAIAASARTVLSLNG